jgi:hypothetical protein
MAALRRLLSTAPKTTTPADLYVITHVDVVPTKRDERAAEARKTSEGWAETALPAAGLARAGFPRLTMFHY